MKTFFAFMILMIGMVMPAVYAVDPPEQTLVISQQHVAPAVMVQEEGGVQAEVIADQQGSGSGPVETQKTIGELMLENWWELSVAFLALFDIIARLTPTQKDNSISNFLHAIWDVIPNYKKGGGTFTARSNP